MLCGLPCSGKSTLARKIETERKAFTFAPDEWIVTILGPKHSDMIGFQYSPNVMILINKLRNRLLEIGVDVIIDDGFTSRASRDGMRKMAAELCVNHKLYFLYCAKEILLQRLQIRNANLKDGEVFIPEYKFKKFLELFEPPDDDEEFILINENT
jgi:hypothetical protein